MPSVRETFEYVPDPQSPAYYVFIWGVPHRPSGTPNKPQQVFRADTWPEAQSFARVFAGLTNQQYATAVALAPRIPDEMGGHGEELARENYWRTDHDVTYDRYTMPAGRVKQLQQEFAGKVAFEVDGAERMRKVRDLMKGAKPGETLADVLARKWEQERQAKAVSKVAELFRHGDFSSKQGRLHPLKKPKKGLVEAFEREGSGWDARLSTPQGYFSFRQWAVRNKKETAGLAELEGALQEAKSAGTDLTASEARSKVEFAEEANDHPWIDIHGAIDFETIEEKARMAETGQRRLEELRKELDEMVAAKVITKEQARDTLVGLEREKLPSKQKKMFEETIASLQKQLAAAQVPPPKQKYKLGQKVQYLGKPDYEISDADLQGRAWVYTVRRIGMPGEFIAREHELRPDLEAPVEEKVPRDAWEAVIAVANKMWDNLRIDGTSQRTFIGNLANWIEEQVKAGRRELSFGGPDVAARFDLLTGTIKTSEHNWERIQEEAAYRFKSVIALQPAPAPPRPPQVMPEELKKPRVRIEMPKVVEPPRKFSQPEVDFLEQAFRTIISRKLRRDPFPAEIDQFEKLLGNMEQMSPPLKFSVATRRMEDLARGIAAKGTPGRIMVRRGQSRVNELLEKSLRQELTEDEKEELERLEGKPPPEFYGTEEMYYEPPKIKIIAEAGPTPAFGGAPMEHGKDYPRLLGSYWTIEIAELNQANFERKGFKVRLEVEK